ncbi:AMP-binding protein [Roseobacter sp. GAI101]|uniref:AMP-binding protein n=1 Tax=Roseobacter sp. (strain GAI101) TaxID=391589 RepID=UPI0001871F96|nr:AMP-binding protein [Roseobacter sp. GAI101]EEB84508.1 long-chain-fatty-acid--CoA ligase [Roseobacter sp. GAI101]
MTIYRSPFPDVPLRDVTITQHVFSHLGDRLDETIVTDGPTGRSLTARQFIDQVQRMAGGLTAAGFGAGHTVALMAPNLPEYCVIFHAVAWAGGTITTLNPTYTASEVKHQLADSSAEMLITVPDFMATATEGAGDLHVVAIGTREYDALFGDPIMAQVPVDLDVHTLVLPYSSGTTGLPKGVMLSHRNLVVNMDQSITGSEFRPGEVAAAFLPFFHIYGMNLVMNIHLALGGIVTMPRFDLAMFLQISQDHKSRRMWTVPPVALALAKHPMVDDYDLSHLEQVLIGAAPSGAELTDAISARLNCITLQGYGMTELSPVSHLIPASRPRSGASGLAAPSTLCRIVDVESGKDLPAGQEGELWVKGPQVMQGYLNNVKATAETIVEDGWLRTGDIALIDEDGYMFVVDRLKELIKFKGFQVAPAELEATLVAMDGIIDAAVIGIPDDDAGEVPIAFVVAGKDAPTDADIHAHFKETLSTYKQLHQIRWVNEVPKSASGKILRRLLRDQVAAG